jgi:light-regulated signal transduction histidine kinase (bacteriophytochrome)
MHGVFRARFGNRMLTGLLDLANMHVRSSMSVSIMAFGQLWGLIACQSYGHHGMRVSFPVRQMMRILSDSISRNIERFSYAQRLHTRKLVRFTVQRYLA